MKLLYTLVAVLCAQLSFAQTNKLLIRNVNVISMASATEQMEQGMDVYISDGKIEKISPASKKKPANTKIIDGTGKYLIPGMADMHVHLPRANAYFNTKQFLNMQLACGITCMRQMRGLPQDLPLRDSIKDGLVTGSDLYVSTPFFRNTKVFDAKACYDSLKLYKKQGYDLVKYLWGMNESQYDSFNNMAKELGFKVAGHAAAGSLAFAVKQGEHIEHIDPFVNAYKKDSNLFWKTIDEMAQKQLFTCPDAHWYNTVGMHIPVATKMKFAGMEYLHDTLKQRFRKEEDEAALKFYNAVPVKMAKYIIEDSTNVAIYKYLLPKMYAKGVPILISPGDGDYVIPGFSYVEELRFFVASGLTPYKTLRCATYNAADFFGEVDKWGTVTVNSAANLVLLNANPLDDINNVTKVDATILHGKVLKPGKLLSVVKK
jgi:imidazolonepropionase-like amidohydrolase